MRIKKVCLWIMCSLFIVIAAACGMAHGSTGGESTMKPTLKAGDNQILLEGIALDDHGLILVSKADPDAVPANSLLQLHADAALDFKPKVADCYQFLLDDAFALSYPPQAQIQAVQKLDTASAVIPASFDLGESLLQIFPEDKVKILDVRTPEEYQSGHLPGSLNLPVQKLPEALPDAVPDKESPVFVYCRSGARSAKAAEILSRQGYVLVFDMGGLTSYEGELLR